MALKKPIIGTNGGAVPEIIKNGVSGLIFKPGDAQDLAEKIKLLFSDFQKRREMGEEGYNRLLSKFHILKNIEATQECYDRLLI